MNLVATGVEESPRNALECIGGDIFYRTSVQKSTPTASTVIVQKLPGERLKPRK